MASRDAGGREARWHRRERRGKLAEMPFRGLVVLAALAQLVLPGCYASHERGDDPDRCAPVGRHTVIQTFSSETMGCGALGMTGTLDVSIPPTPETFMGAGDVEVVMTGPCSWTVHAATAIPDFVTDLEGTIDTGDGFVHGSFRLEITGLAGTTCVATIGWSEPR